MIKTLLIANRGEIACRIMKTAQARGITCIAIYSEADRNAPHVKIADRAVALGGNTPEESYLRGDKVLKIAMKNGCDAVHPGYGFLSENTEFAQSVTAAGLIFVGPSSEAIAIMGDKAAAKSKMQEVGVPCIKGYNDDQQHTAHLAEKAQEIGFPLMIKAIAGGGGRGMRFVEDASDVKIMLDAARSEAESSFGNGDLILERAYAKARHIEIQIAADQHGNVIHLFERDCSTQRRHQKVIEEAPSPALDDELRKKMGEAAILAARAVGYCGLGTVEFLLDQEGNFFFLEMNTRLQVEHPVTEEITGRDLVGMQIDIANGEALPPQDDIKFEGHAIELRLYAEDPAENFMPSIGQITFWHPAPNVRVDAGIETGSEISPYYDAMIAKIIISAKTRKEALIKAQAALQNTVTLGIRTNTGFLSEILNSDSFVSGRMTTDFIDTTFSTKKDVASWHEVALAGALILEHRLLQNQQHAALPNDLIGWSTLTPSPISTVLTSGTDRFPLTYSRDGASWCIDCENEQFKITFISKESACYQAKINEGIHTFFAQAREDHVDLAFGLSRARFEIAKRDANTQGNNENTLSAPLPSKVQSVFVQKGEIVKKGDQLILLEAMKMQHPIIAPCEGTVAEIFISEGDQVPRGAQLVEIEPHDVASED
jgi:geranyl-CoA carboxylase alpha subunit